MLDGMLAGVGAGSAANEASGATRTVAPISVAIRKKYMCVIRI
jgi:hypothetical protein